MTDNKKLIELTLDLSQGIKHSDCGIVNLHVTTAEEIKGILEQQAIISSCCKKDVLQKRHKNGQQWRVGKSVTPYNKAVIV